MGETKTSVSDPYHFHVEPDPGPVLDPDPEQIPIFFFLIFSV